MSVVRRSYVGGEWGGDAPTPPDPTTPWPTSPDQVGIPVGTVLTPVNGDLYLSTAGATYDAREVFGRVIVQAADITLKRSRVHGKIVTPGDEGWAAGINAVSASALRFTVEDCELSGAQESRQNTGVFGHGYTARRCYLHDFVDFFAFSAGSAAETITIEDCYVGLNTWWAPVGYTPDKVTHNDSMQRHNGSASNVIVRRNYFDCWNSADSGNPPATTPEYGAYRPQALSILMFEGGGNFEMYENFCDGGGIAINGRAGTNNGKNLGRVHRNVFTGAAFSPPISIAVGAILDDGYGTANANTTPDGTPIPPIEYKTQG